MMAMESVRVELCVGYKRFMARTWKDVLTSGRYRLSDGRVVTYTAEHVRQAAENGNAMLSAGLRCPGCWEHDQEAEPTYLSQSNPMSHLARGYWGEPVRFEDRGGVLWAELDVPDQADADQLAKVRTVSPRIDFDFVDERGKLWPGCSIGHIAATPKPVQRDQKPVMFSQSKLNTKRRESHFLSQATRETGSLDPKKAAGLLAKLGIHLGDGLTDWNDFGARLEAAVATKSGNTDSNDDDDLGDEGLGTTIEGGASETTASPPVMMSQTIQGRMNQLIGAERAELSRRVDRLQRTMRIDGPTHRKLKAAVSAANLSLSGTGQLQFDPLVARIEAYESLPEKAALNVLKPKGNLSQVSVVEPPDGLKPSDGKTEALAFLRKKPADNTQRVAG
jgi:hypothetical protein